MKLTPEQIATKYFTPILRDMISRGKGVELCVLAMQDVVINVIEELNKIVVTTGNGEHDEIRCAVCGATYNDWTKFRHYSSCKWAEATGGKR